MKRYKQKREEKTGNLGCQYKICSDGSYLQSLDQKAAEQKRRCKCLGSQNIVFLPTKIDFHVKLIHSSRFDDIELSTRPTDLILQASIIKI